MKKARWAAVLSLGCMAVLWAVAAAGPSVSSPDLGGWSLPGQWSATWVIGLTSGAYVLGAIAIGLGLVAARAGHGPPAWAAFIGLALALATLFVPPMGSADHLNYAAYGRIAAEGGDPYRESPIAWQSGQDPITSAVEPPWTTTPSIYGPVATAAQAAASSLGGENLRATVLVWQLLCLLSWLLVSWLLRGRGPRALWLWLLNPILYGVLLLGAHVDLLAAALGLAALLLTAALGLERGNSPARVRGFSLLIGGLLGAAIGIKLTAGIFAVAVLVAVVLAGRHRWQAISCGLFGAFLVLIPAHLWAGPEVFTQLRRARGYISLASPWRPLATALTDPWSGSAVRTAISLVAVPVLVLVAWAVWRLLPKSTIKLATSGQPGPSVPELSARIAIALAAGYILVAPYSLPWYDALAWAPLAFVGVSAIDGVLLLRLVSYAVAYVPGRVLPGPEPSVELMLTLRRGVIPWVGWGLWFLVIFLAVRAAADSRKSAVE